MKLSRKIRAWLELVRVPNLLTVPGDPLAGYLLSGGAAAYGIFHILPVALSSVCIYCFGLILNDLSDVDTDRRERPNRPLPSGRVNIAAGRVAALFFLLWGLAMAWLTDPDAGLAASALAGAVIAYNVYLKGRPVSGPLSMGACRGLSMMMGAAAGGGIDYRLALAVAGLTLYVAAFTAIARLEMKTVTLGIRRWFPALVLVVMFTMLFAVSREDIAGGAIFFKSALPALLSIGLAVMCGRRLVRGRDIPGVIGGFIANLMLVQSSLCVISGNTGQITGALIACMVPLFVVSNLKFYSS